MTKVMLMKVQSLNALAAVIHEQNKRWWYDAQGNKLQRNEGELIALMHSELSEALEALRKSTKDSHLPHRTGVEVELADCLIRIFDYCGAKGLDIDGALAEKLEYNARRADHTYEARAKPDGKKF